MSSEGCQCYPGDECSPCTKLRNFETERMQRSQTEFPDARNPAVEQNGYRELCSFYRPVKRRRFSRPKFHIILDIRISGGESTENRLPLVRV